MNVKLNNKSLLEVRKGDLLVTKDAMYLVISELQTVDNLDLMRPKYARRSMSQAKYRLLNINNNMLMEETFNSLSAILDKFGHVITRIVSANNLTLNETEKTDVIAGWLTD